MKTSYFFNVRLLFIFIFNISSAQNGTVPGQASSHCVDNGKGYLEGQTRKEGNIILKCACEIKRKVGENCSRYHWEVVSTMTSTPTTSTTNTIVPSSPNVNSNASPAQSPVVAKPLFKFDKSKAPGGPFLNTDDDFKIEQDFDCKKSRIRDRAIKARECMGGDTEACLLVSDCYDWCSSESTGDNKYTYITASDAMRNLRRSWLEYKALCKKTKEGANSPAAKAEKTRIEHMVEMNKVAFNIDEL